jgi:predicted DCC family thiol-disulfide oxidoreductase YuxK
MATSVVHVAARKEAWRHRRAQVFYDGFCPLCRKSVHLLQQLDWLGVLEYIDVRQDTPHVQELPVAAERLLEEMHLRTPDRGQVLHGFAAFRWMAWRLPLLWTVAPWLYLPGMARVGQWAYLWVARHRFQLVPCHGGLCTLKPP